VKGYEELINGKSVQPNIKLFLSLMQKINQLFLRNSWLFLSALYKIIIFVRVGQPIGETGTGITRAADSKYSSP